MPNIETPDKALTQVSDERLIIRGGRPLVGTVKIGGAKNAVLKIINGGYNLEKMSENGKKISKENYTKEKYFLQKVLEKGMDRKEFHRTSIAYMIVQLKGLWIMPFLNTNYLREVLYVFPNERFFAEKYAHEVYKWIDEVLCKKESKVS